MKLHEAEKYTSNYGDGYRRAVPGGWLYIETQNVGTGHAPVFVPDPAAEHVRPAEPPKDDHGAKAAAVACVYSEAVADCCEVIEGAAGSFGVDPLQVRGLIAALRGIRFNGSTSQTGEGVDIQTEDAVRAARVAALGEAADLVKAVVVRWREVGQPLNQNDRAGFILESRILALAEPSP